MAQPDPDELIEMHMLIKGHVQGVGFRASVKRLAHNLGLAGTVQNTKDGHVELSLLGSRKTILELLQALHQAFGPIHIAEVASNEIMPQQNYADFRIIF